MSLGGILETVRGIFPILSPTRLGMVPAFTFGMTCGAEKSLKYSVLELYSIARNKKAMSVISASPDVPLVFGLNPHPCMPLVKVATHSSLDAAHDLEIASVAVRKPILARVLRQQGFLNPRSSDADRCCLPELGLGCSLNMSADQSSPADCVVMDYGEDGLASLLALVVRDDGEDGNFPTSGICPPMTPLDWALFCIKDIGPVVGLSCEGNEDKAVALLVLTATE
jgi:hypothetical protein